MPTEPSVEGSKHGSRRRRIWELGPHAHCPVVGVCLPIATLRRLVNKALGGEAIASDYDLHCGAVTDCQKRSRIGENIQRELDRRYLLDLRQAAALKSTEALALWWERALTAHDIPGPLWAVVTHPRCTPALETQVLGHVHMLQHQAGMSIQIDLKKVDSLIDENARLAREVATAQAKAGRATSEQQARAVAHGSELAELRSMLVAREAAVERLQSDLRRVEDASPHLLERLALASERDALAASLKERERELSHARSELARRDARIDGLLADLEAIDPVDADGDAAASSREPVELADRSVLCVGGRTTAVPLYRRIIEGTGARFLHHDGGEEQSVAQLDSTLAAADLVICQAGCINHGAYWRVKDHCKRTGKRCVFVANPSSAGLKRAILDLLP